MTDTDTNNTYNNQEFEKKTRYITSGISLRNVNEFYEKKFRPVLNTNHI